MTRLLIVDDDPDVRSLLSDGLVRAGYEVRTAADGLEALGLLGSMLLDVVLSDVSMPRLDGWELLRQCRASAWLRSMPVVMMSAAPGLAELAIARGAAGFLAKPFAWQEAQRAVELALRRSDSADG